MRKWIEDFRLTILDFRFKRKMERTHYKQEINITEGLMSRINELISYYPEDKRKSALLPVLHEVQDAHDNWSIELMDKVAEILYKPIEVYEVVSFTRCTTRDLLGNTCSNFVKPHLVV
jgi:NADH-quinone oxidoreductase subunit E